MVMDDGVDCAAVLDDEPAVMAVAAVVDEVAPVDPGNAAVPMTGDRVLAPTFDAGPGLPSVEGVFLWPAFEAELADEKLPPGAAAVVAVAADASPRRCLAVARSDIS